MPDELLDKLILVTGMSLVIEIVDKLGARQRIDYYAHAAGGGSGIGRACCILFAREGATVVVTDIAGHEATLNMLDGNLPTAHKCARHRHRAFSVCVRCVQC